MFVLFSLFVLCYCNQIPERCQRGSIHFDSQLQSSVYGHLAPLFLVSGKKEGHNRKVSVPGCSLITEARELKERAACGWPASPFFLSYFIWNPRLIMPMSRVCDGHFSCCYDRIVSKDNVMDELWFRNTVQNGGEHTMAGGNHSCD